MVYTWGVLKKACIADQHFKSLFFWGHTPSADGLIAEACLSQWQKCNFTADGTIYSCVEQLVMAEKTRMFSGRDMLGNIMEAREPEAIKTYGRAVKNFDRETWDAVCYEPVREGDMAEFSQNPELWEFLKSTKKQILVEASPRDRIRGIGVGESNPDAGCPLKWKGSNLLGFTLTRARDLLPERGEGMD